MTDLLVTVSHGTSAALSPLASDPLPLESQAAFFGGDAGVLAGVHCDLGPGCWNLLTWRRPSLPATHPHPRLCI